MSIPIKVVGIGVLRARGNGRRAELHLDVLARGGRVSGRNAKGIVLVQTAAESTVIVHVDRGGVNFVTAYGDGMLAGSKPPMRRGLPFDPEEIRGVERVLFVDFLIQALPYAEA